MSTIEEIAAAAAQLEPAQFLQLRQRLDQVEEELWEAELAQATKELEQTDLSDEALDQMLMRHRDESRD